MFGPEYFTVVAYSPKDSGTIVCRRCGEAAELPTSDSLTEAEVSGDGAVDEFGLYCDSCGAEIIAPTPPDSTETEQAK